MPQPHVCRALIWADLHQALGQQCYMLMELGTLNRQVQEAMYQTLENKHKTTPLKIPLKIRLSVVQQSPTEQRSFQQATQQNRCRMV